MDSRRRYYSETFCGLPVEKTCYVFSIINFVLVCLCVVACFFTEGYLIARFVIHTQTQNYFLESTTFLIWCVYAVACVFTATYGIFAVFLLQGLRLNKPSLLRCYLLFGLILEASMVISTVIYTLIIVNLSTSDPDCTIYYGCIALWLFICVFYGFILALVQRAYLIISSRSKRNNVINEQTMLYVCERV